MLKRLHLERFKNFRNAELALGPFTLLLGANATGKSNLRDAFRFLHGVSRGYTIAEIIGEKWIEGGVLQWKGIRGGTREATFASARTFGLRVDFGVDDETSNDGDVSPIRTASYWIEVDLGQDGSAPRVVGERLTWPGTWPAVFDSHPDYDPPEQNDPSHLAVRVWRKQQGKPPQPYFINSRPVLTQIVENRYANSLVSECTRATLRALSSMRFLDLAPDAMRIPSIPGQTILGDRGENLSSVLQSICQSPEDKAALVEWVKELTPMDARDFEFPTDQVGRILVTLVEEGGQKTSAYSASDGTLRFLAMIAALLGPEPTRFSFFEELENGIHPNRLHLLLQLIERRVAEGGIQMVATTHSPQLLHLVSPATLEHASLTYRLEGEQEGRITRVLDIPGALEVIQTQDLARLHESGWFEDVVAFARPELAGV